MAGSFASSYSDEDDSATLSDINVTPLVDVTLVLLIVFMITVPVMVSSARIQVNVPETSEVAQVPDPVTLVISLRREASGELSLYLNDQMTTHNELRSRLEAYNQIAEDLPPVILAADKDLPYAEVIKVLDLTYAAGIRRVSLDTKHTASP
ncbi:MAG: biopolymer transporter ExbD [Planctomycetaceae bacterium]|nr:biopolymer transporter ExbD [Planctomycetaceae bacterium]